MHPTFLFLRLEVVLVLWAVISLIVLAWAAYREGWSWDLLLMAAVFTAVGSGLYWFVPKMGIVDASGAPGLAVRGYGFFVALGVAAGVALAAYNAHRVGLPRDAVFSAAFAMLVGGFIGARLFYVIEYFEDFRRESTWETLLAVLRYYEGGLVVYGGFIGGTVGFLVYTWWRRIPSLNLLDAMAPGMTLGLAFGRIGCLMNGCCWGGICTTAIAISFPAGSPPFMRHLETGELLGFHLERHENGGWRVAHVDDRSRASRMGLRAGDRVVVWEVAGSDAIQEMAAKSERDRVVARLVTADGLEITWTFGQIPHRSLPVHPTQIYSALNALFLTVVLFIFLPYRRRPGDVVALLLTLYPIARFLLEWVRSDEPGIAGTALTISQWVSIALFSLALAWWAVTWRLPRDPKLPRPGDKAAA